MASRKISDLIKPLRDQVARVEVSCAQEGVAILVYCTFRDAYEQARCFRKSRTIQQITLKSDKLIERGYPSLARILVSVGPQAGVLGKHVTWAGPGESWHQYAMAFDAVPMLDGKCLWSYGKHGEEWEIYGNAVEDAGLGWGGRFRDYPHAQAAKQGNPLDVLSYEMVCEQLKLDLGN